MTTSDALQGLVGLGQAKLVTERLASGAADTHAVLFYGPEGSGKTELANALAQAWLCTSPGTSGACGVCSGCQAMGRGTHPDLLRVEPQPPSYLIRLNAVSGNEETLSIQQLFRTPPLMGRHKVVIVKDAERMNADAANAFLKTLEEPPASARIILTSSSPGALLATILSRCLAVACQLPNDAELAAAFPTAVPEQLILAGGSAGRLKQILDQTEVQSDLWDFARGLSSMEPRQALIASERFRAIADAREKRTGEGARRSQSESLAELGLMLRTLGVHRALPAITEAHRRILGNGNASLVFDQLFAGILMK